MIKKSRFFISLAAILLGFFGWLLIDVYWQNWFYPHNFQLVGRLSLPLAKVNGQLISTTDYWKDLQASKSNQTLASLSMVELNQAILTKLIRQQVVAELVKQQGLDLGQPDYRAILENLLGNQPAEVSLDQQIEQSFGYSYDDFIKLVVEPFYWEEKLQLNFLATADSKEQQQAQQIKAEAAGTNSLAALAKKYGLEQSLNDQFLSAEDLVGPLVNIKALKKDDISDIIIDTDGYHLYQLLNHLTEAERDLWQVQQLDIQSISWDSFLNQQLQLAEVKYFIELPGVN